MLNDKKIRRQEANGLAAVLRCMQPELKAADVVSAAPQAVSCTCTKYQPSQKLNLAALFFPVRQGRASTHHPASPSPTTKAP